jgi:hypothetical protein
MLTSFRGNKGNAHRLEGSGEQQFRATIEREVVTVFIAATFLAIFAPAAQAAATPTSGTHSQTQRYHHPVWC